MRRFDSPLTGYCRAFGLVISMAAGAIGQAKEPASDVVGPQLIAAIADSSHRDNVPAIQWLCQECLPKLPQWPTDLDPSDAFSISLSATNLRIQKTEVEVPVGSVAIGNWSFSTNSNAPQIAFSCDENGREQWIIPDGFELPSRWRSILNTLHANDLDTPRTLSIPVIIGHLAGGLLDNDPRSALLRLGPSLCGDATWIAWYANSKTHVCGRSDGGLVLPLTFLWLAFADGVGELPSLSLRAFASRDADQAEAARQMGRGDRDLQIRTLRALLHAEDEVRLTAIESLVRHGAADELPAIICAAGKRNPLATIAARDAVFRLWPTATFSERSEARTALKQSQVGVLSELDFEDLATDRSQQVVAPFAHTTSSAKWINEPRTRTMLILLCTSVGLLILWLRERARIVASAST